MLARACLLEAEAAFPRVSDWYVPTCCLCSNSLQLALALAHDNPDLVHLLLKYKHMYDINTRVLARFHKMDDYTCPPLMIPNVSLAMKQHLIDAGASRHVVDSLGVSDALILLVFSS